MPVQTRMRLAFDVFVIAFFAWTGYEALEFRTLAKYLPLTVSAIALALSLVALALDWRNWKGTGTVIMGDVPETAAMYGAEQAEIALDEVEEEGEAARVAAAKRVDADLEEVEDPRAVVRRAGVMVLWILGYVLVIWLVGILAASAAFLLAYLFLEARAGWKVPVIGTVLILAGMSLLKELLNLTWPDYLLQRFWS